MAEIWGPLICWGMLTFHNGALCMVEGTGLKNEIILYTKDAVHGAAQGHGDFLVVNHPHKFLVPWYVHFATTLVFCQIESSQKKEQCCHFGREVASLTLVVVLCDCILVAICSVTSCSCWEDLLALHTGRDD